MYVHIVNVHVYIYYRLQVSLNLSNNRLSSLPEDMGVLSSLKELFLQYNNLTQLPVSAADLLHYDTVYM